MDQKLRGLDAARKWDESKLRVQVLLKRMGGHCRLISTAIQTTLNNLGRQTNNASGGLYKKVKDTQTGKAIVCM